MFFFENSLGILKNLVSSIFDKVFHFFYIYAFFYVIFIFYPFFTLFWPIALFFWNFCQKLKKSKKNIFFENSLGILKNLLSSIFDHVFHFFYIHAFFQAIFTFFTLFWQNCTFFQKLCFFFNRDSSQNILNGKGLNNFRDTP